MTSGATLPELQGTASDNAAVPQNNSKEENTSPNHKFPLATEL
jgi:hypothetical protein